MLAHVTTEPLFPQFLLTHRIDRSNKLRRYIAILKVKFIHKKLSKENIKEINTIVIYTRIQTTQGNPRVPLKERKNYIQC